MPRHGVFTMTCRRRGRCHITASRVQSARTMGLSVVIPVGTAHERPGEAGFAHLSEHLMHQYARDQWGETVEDQIVRVGGISNAQTYPFHTEYSFVIPAPAEAEIPDWIDRAIARVAPPRITSVDIECEGRIIRQEVARRMSTSPTAGFPWIDALGVLSTDFGLRHNGFSDLADIEAATPEAIENFLGRTYSPAPVAVGVAGPWSPDLMLDLLGCEEGEPETAASDAYTAAFGDLIDGPHHRHSSVATQIPMYSSIRYVPDAHGAAPESAQAHSMIAVEWANAVSPGTHWQAGLFGATMGPDHRVLIGSRPHGADLAVPQWTDTPSDLRSELFVHAQQRALDNIDKELSSTATHAAMLARDSAFGIQTWARRCAVAHTTPEEIDQYLGHARECAAGTVSSAAPIGVGRS